MIKLNSAILDHLTTKTGKTPATIRKDISLIRREYPNCTINAAAHLYAMKNRLSVLQKLDKEDKSSLPNVNIENAPVIKVKKNKSSKKIVEFINYKSDDYFISGHIKEVNKAYTYGCYTAAFVLIRKIVENLIIDILRKKFPEKSSKENLELYYNITYHRLHDFSIVLNNLNKKKTEFGIDGIKIIERLFPLLKEMKKDTNDKVHSYYHLVETKSEFDNINIAQIFELIIKLESMVGLR